MAHPSQKLKGDVCGTIRLWIETTHKTLGYWDGLTASTRSRLLLWAKAISWLLRGFQRGDYKSYLTCANQRIGALLPSDPDTSTTIFSRCPLRALAHRIYTT